MIILGLILIILSIFLFVTIIISGSDKYGQEAFISAFRAILSLFSIGLGFFISGIYKKKNSENNKHSKQNKNDLISDLNNKKEYDNNAMVLAIFSLTSAIISPLICWIFAIIAIVKSKNIKNETQKSNIYFISIWSIVFSIILLLFFNNVVWL